MSILQYFYKRLQHLPCYMHKLFDCSRFIYNMLPVIKYLALTKNYQYLYVFITYKCKLLDIVSSGFTRT